MRYTKSFFLISMFYFLQGCSLNTKSVNKNNDPGEYLQKIKIYSIPNTFNFAGEKIPLELPDVREKFDRELHINSYLHSSTILLLKRSQRWLPEISKILLENGIPLDFKYLPVIESS